MSTEGKTSDEKALPLTQVVLEIADEYRSARVKHRPMHSAHEGYAVIKEELDELWDEIKVKVPDTAKMRAEAMQVAAMALAFVIEVCDREASK